MRLLVHDFAGHPFPVQLSRHLAARGHSVTHAYALGLQGPKGRLMTGEGDPSSLNILGIQLMSGFRKYSPHRRLVAQRGYADQLRRVIAEIRPNVVLSGNTPIDIQAELLWYCRRRRIGFVHWIQDIYCQALKFFLKRRMPWVPTATTLVFELLERQVVARSDQTVVIAPEFLDVLERWGVATSKVRLIENWAALDEIPMISRENSWRQTQQLGPRPMFLYSGTLGIKHRPELLYLLAERLQKECTVVVITEGVGRDYLDQRPRLENLRILDFQPYETMPQVLASADVLLATLEADAGPFAVPSKILSYLCAGRPILLASPRENLAASVIERSRAGFVINPNDFAAWVDAAQLLSSDLHLRTELGNKARCYAERSFNITRIADEFENVLSSAYQTYANVSSTVSVVTA